jgi:hypothetical protein
VFVITADQVDSRRNPDAVASTLTRVNARPAGDLVVAAERTAGDEFQLLTSSAPVALDLVLSLAREGDWSIGLGVGEVREPVPASIREATGDAFIAARTAVDRAKKKQSRFAIESIGNAAGAAGIEAFVDLLLATRDRRSPEGWELFDLLESGLTQGGAAARIGISPQAASRRAQAADLKIDLAVTGALGTLLSELDESSPKE